MLKCDVMYVYDVDCVAQVCKELRERYKTSALPVIMVSAKDQEKEIVQGLKV